MALVKADATLKADKDYKAGDEIKLTGVSVDAHDEDLQGIVKDRLARQEKSITDKLTAKYEAELAEAKKGAAAAPADTKLAEQVKELSGKLAQSDLDKAVDAEIKAQGASNLDAAYRARITVKPGAAPEEIKAAVTAAVTEQAAFLKAHGLDGKTTTQKVEGLGFAGTTGSLDTNAQLESQTLENKLNSNRPDLKGLIAGVGPEKKLALLKEYDLKGLLAPRKK